MKKIVNINIDRSPIIIDNDIVIKLVGYNYVSLLSINGKFMSLLSFYDLQKMCEELMKSNFGSEYNMNDFCEYFDIELSFYEKYSEKWSFVCQKICFEWDNYVITELKNQKNINICYHFKSWDEAYYFEEYRIFMSYLFNLPTRDKILIYNQYAIINDKNLILDNNRFNILKICDNINISENKFYSKYNFIFQSDKYIYKINGKYQTSNFEDYEDYDLFSILCEISKDLFCHINIWNKYINKENIIGASNFEDIFAKNIFKIDILNESLLFKFNNKYDITENFRDTFYLLCFSNNVLDYDYLDYVELFYRFSIKFPWANRYILKWYIFKFYPKHKDDKCFDIEDYFKMNYSLFYEKHKINK